MFQTCQKLSLPCFPPATQSSLLLEVVANVIIQVMICDSVESAQSSQISITLNGDDYFLKFIKVNSQFKSFQLKMKLEENFATQYHRMGILFFQYDWQRNNDGKVTNIFEGKWLQESNCDISIFNINVSSFFLGIHHFNLLRNLEWVCLCKIL